MVRQLNADGSTRNVTLEDHVTTPLYLKLGGTSGAAVATHVVSGVTAVSETGASISETTGSIASGDGTGGSAEIIESVGLDDPGHTHGPGTLLTDLLGEPPHTGKRSWFRQ
jgi:hypothetical protein